MQHAAAIRSIVRDNMLADSPLGRALEATAASVEDLERRLCRLEMGPLAPGGMQEPQRHGLFQRTVPPESTTEAERRRVAGV